MAGFAVADTAPFEDWQSGQAEYFRRLFAGALERLVEARADAGEFETALPHARRWLALDPLNESAQRAIMRLLAGMGDRSGAIRQYEACVQILRDELGIRPQPETEELYQAILHGEIAGTKRPAAVPRGAEARPLSRLPQMPTPFIGRRAEVEEVKSLLANAAHRLVTLVGPGGTGKTRLSIQAASELVDSFPDGVFFASLASVQSAEAIPPALAKALDFAFQREGESPRGQLLDFLREKHLLLILDNFEHLLEGTGLVIDILTQAAGVKLMVTSRVRLNMLA
jgi:tetratricopeptide (TPR) repeat protein